jgi:hypothetical protein
MSYSKQSIENNIEFINPVDKQIANYFQENGSHFEKRFEMNCSANESSFSVQKDSTDKSNNLASTIIADTSSSFSDNR